MGSYDYTISIGHLGEQLTLNQWVLGSSPRWRTKEKPYRNVGLFSFVQPSGKLDPVRHRRREQLEGAFGAVWYFFRVYGIILDKKGGKTDG